MAFSDDEQLYRTISSQDEHELGLGGALISLVEPNAGHEVAFNRWYEDDHYYAGAMNMPWLFAGGRYVATRPLQKLRRPAKSDVIEPIDRGCYLHLFWIARNHVDDLAIWAQGTNERLRATGDRIFTDRSHVFTHFHDYREGRRRDPNGPKDYQTLDGGYPGVVLEIVEAAGDHDVTQLGAWLLDTYVPWLREASNGAIAHTLWFTPRPPPAGQRSAGNQAQVARSTSDLAVLVHFLERDPTDVWASTFERSESFIDEAGIGSLQLAAPFIPVAFGTARYTDELR